MVRNKKGVYNFCETEVYKDLSKQFWCPVDDTENSIF